MKDRIQSRSLAGIDPQFRELLEAIALRAATAGVATLTELEEALRFVLERVCHHMGWPVGHVYVPAPDSDGDLVSARIWHLEDPPALDGFRRTIEEMRLTSQAGVPGRVLSTGRPAWAVDAGRESGCPRAPTVRQAGLKSLFAFPIMAEERIQAVLEFFSREAMEANEELLAATTSIGAELGRAFERSREAWLGRQAAELYRSVVETSPDAIIVTDLNGVVMMSNKQAAVHYGFDGPDELRGLSAFDFVAPEDRERAWENSRRTLKEGAVRQVEYNLLRKDGSRAPVELSASVIRDRQGQPRAFIAVVRDLSRRRESERALRTSEEKFRTLTQMNAAATFIYKKGRLLYANDAAAAMTGYTVEEMLSIDPWKLVHPDYHAVLNEAWERSLREGSSPRHLELKLVTKSGEVRWMDYSAHLVQWEGRTAALGTSFDITERKEVEEALRLSEERYRALYHDNPSMYFTVDSAGMVMSVNQFGAEQLGYTPEELTGKPVLDVFYEEDRPEVARQLAICISTPGEMANWEFRKVRRDGEIIYVKEAARATVDSAGRTTVLIVCEDVTERKRMEEELQRAREELERKVERQVQTKGVYGLTFRELTVLHLVATGSSDKDIAIKLGISPLTVSKHVANILTKMHASSRSEASARAVQESLLELS